MGPRPQEHPLGAKWTEDMNSDCFHSELSQSGCCPLGPGGAGGVAMDAEHGLSCGVRSAVAFPGAPGDGVAVDC
jgi:hypothetical protein